MAKLTPPTIMLDAVDSTMRKAERLAASGRTGPLVICARSQTGGAGRHGRPWASPPGNLYWTILLDAEADRPRDAGLAFAAGLAVIDALITLAVPSDRLRLKWPNDVLLDGRKLAGVLAQSTLTGQLLRTIVGIGVNVAVAPAHTAYPATSLAASGLPLPALDTLRDSLTTAFLERRATWHRSGLAPLSHDVSLRLHGTGAPVRVALDRDRTQVMSGVNEGIGSDGCLRVRSADGIVHTVVAGDILA